MASPNAVFTELVTTTLREHPSAIADNVSDHNALWNRLTKKGRVSSSLDGGYEIVEPLEYAENSTFTRYSGYDPLNISGSDVFSAAKFDWVQAALAVTASGRELRMNSGKNRIIPLMKSRTKNAMKTASNNMSVDLYSSGALANQMGGLAHVIQTNGQGTVGGINSTNFPFWQNQFREIAGTNTWTKSNIKTEMKQMWLACVRGTDKPDLIVSTHDFYSAYWENLDDQRRFRSNDVPDTFDSVKFMSADVIFDNNDNFPTTGERMYFLNTDYLSIRYHPDANWTAMEENSSTNQDAVVVLIIWQGQLCVSNRARQGILLDAA